VHVPRGMRLSRWLRTCSANSRQHADLCVGLRPGSAKIGLNPGHCSRSSAVLHAAEWYALRNERLQKPTENPYILIVLCARSLFRCTSELRSGARRIRPTVARHAGKACIWLDLPPHAQGPRNRHPQASYRSRQAGEQDAAACAPFPAPAPPTHESKFVNCVPASKLSQPEYACECEHMPSERPSGAPSAMCLCRHEQDQVCQNWLRQVCKMPRRQCNTQRWRRRRSQCRGPQPCVYTPQPQAPYGRRSAMPSQQGCLDEHAWRRCNTPLRPAAVWTSGGCPPRRRGSCWGIPAPHEGF
jgi:hypothetical protein